MGGLFHTMGVAKSGLFVNRQGLDTTSNNIANAQTEGYSRQRVNIGQREPSEWHNVIIGNGVFVDGITRSHDQFVEKQINNANSAAAESELKHQALLDLEAIFSPELNSSVSDEISKFFSSLQALSSNPEDLTARTAVVESAKNVAMAFQRVERDLKRNQGNLDENLRKESEELTDSLKSIAELNIRIRELENGNKGTANDLRDQRDKLVRGVSEKVDIHYYLDRHGMLTVRGPNEILLVDGARAGSFGVANVNGALGVMVTDSENSQSREISDTIRRGKLRAIMDVRDGVAGGLRRNNNMMAAQFVEQMNAIHRRGFGLGDFRETVGRNFWAPVEHAETAASSIRISQLINDQPDAISAASAPNSPGDNVNVNDILRLRNEKVFGESSSTLNEFYANFVGSLGVEVVRASHVKDADDVLMADLLNRREAISGVSLDEEAANLIKWQTAFTASSKVITTVDEMFETVLGLKR